MQESDTGDDPIVVEELSLRAGAAAIDGSDVIRASAVGSLADAEQLGRDLARELLDLGARDLLATAAEGDLPAAGAAGDLPAAGADNTDFTNSSPMENKP